MRATRIENADPLPIGAPPDWSEETHGHCGALFVRREIVHELPFMRSAWEVDPGEAAMLYVGARLELAVQGVVHPVVSLGISAAPEDFEPVVHSRLITMPGGVKAARVEMLFNHNGGSRAGATVALGPGGFAAAVSAGIVLVEQFAKRRGWTQ